MKLFPRNGPYHYDGSGIAWDVSNALWTNAPWTFVATDEESHSELLDAVESWLRADLERRGYAWDDVEFERYTDEARWRLYRKGKSRVLMNVQAN